MSVIIRESEIDVNIEEELEPYLEEHFNRHQIRGEKLQACSPFRHEKTPSFAVNLENGTWIDSGADDDSWRKGNFVKLLSYLMAVTYEEAEEYLWEKYRTIYADVDSLELFINLHDEETFEPISETVLDKYEDDFSYLYKRGITEKVQKGFNIKKDTKNDAVVIVWRDKNGQIINLKYRSIKDKKFWYLEDGQPIKRHIFGLHFIVEKGYDKCFVTESETDALYLWSFGIPAIALGSANLSKHQEKLLINSPINKLILAFDDDKAGYRCKLDVERRLQGVIDLFEMKMPWGCKDVNDIQPSKMKESIRKVQPLLPTFL